MFWTMRSGPHLLASAAAVMVAVAVPFVAQPPATASPLNGCEKLNDPSWDASTSSLDSFLEYAFTAGETVTVIAQDPTGQVPESFCFGTDWNTPLVSTSFPGTLTYTFASPTTLPAMVIATVPGGSVSFTVSCAVTGVPTSSTATADGTAPPPWHQSYARAGKDEVCAEGWHPSYAMWPNDGQGGWVCNRTLSYKGSVWTWDAG
jgi:hypothetical protein